MEIDPSPSTAIGIPAGRLSDLVPCGLTRTDTEGRLVSVNPAYCVQTGYTAEELLGERPQEVLRGPDTDASTVELIERQAAAQTTFVADVLNYRKGGRPYWVRLEAEPVFERGLFVGYITIETDVTAKHENERARVEAETLYARMFELAPDAIVLHDGTTIVKANAAACALTGLDDPRGRPVLEFIADDEREAIETRTVQTLADGQTIPLFDHRVIGVDGRVAHVETTANRVTYQGQPAVLAILRDVTAEREAERARAEAESLYTQLFDTAPDAIVVTDGERILEANGTVTRLLGVPDVQGHRLSDYLTDADAELIRSQAERVLESGETLPLFTHGIAVPGGETLDVETTASRVTYRGRPAVLAVIRNVAAQRAAERARAEAETLYTRIFETAPEPIVVHNGEVIVAANRAAHTLVGADDLVGADFMSFADPRDVAETTERIAHVLKTGETIPLFDVRVRSTTGELLHIQATTTGVTYNGKPAVLAIIRDVTVQKATKDRVHLLAQAFQSVSDAVLVHDLEGEITYVNDAASHVYGHDPRDLHGAHIAGLFPEGQQPSAMLSGHRKTRSQGFAADTVHVRANGDRFPVAITNDPIYKRSGELIGFVMVARDVTDARHQEALLAQEQHRYRTFVQTITEAIFRYDIPAPIAPGTPVDEALEMMFDGVLGECNDHYARMLGYESAAEIRGRKLRDLFLSTEDGELTPAKRHMLTAFIENGFTLTEHIFNDGDPDGRTFSANAIALRDPSGIIGLWGTRRDLTQIYRLTRQISAVAGQAQNRLASILHDGILQRMAAAQGFIDNALYDLTHGPCEEAKIEKILQFTTKAHNEIKGSMQDSRLLMKDLSPLEKHGGLGGALEDHAVYITDQQGIRTTVEARTDAPDRLEKGDADVIYWIVREACNNAIKHAGADRIRVCIDEDDEYLVVTVDDNGVGIPAEVLEAAESTDDGGWGLPGMRLRANLMGAELTVDPLPDDSSGTRVQCLYPLIRLCDGPVNYSPDCPE